MGTLNMHFRRSNISKTKMSMNFQIGIYIHQDLGSRDPIFGIIGQRSSSQGHIMYVAKICLNSVLGGPISFILGG